MNQEMNPTGNQPAHSHSRSRGGQRVAFLAMLIAEIGLLLYMLFLRHLHALDTPLHIPWWLLTAMFLGAEVFIVHLQFRRDAHSFALSEIPLVAGLFFVSPGILITAQLVGAAIALLRRRQSLLKLTFNLANFMLNAVIVTLVFRAVVNPANPIGPTGWIAAFAATAAGTAMSVLTINLAMYLSGAGLNLHAVWNVISISLGISLTNTSLALIEITILWHQPGAGWLILVPASALFLAYRAYASGRQKHESLEQLYRASRVAQRSLKLEETQLALLSQAREMFRAEIAHILLLPLDDDDLTLQTTLGPDDNFDLMRPVTLDPLDTACESVMTGQRAVLVPRTMHDEDSRVHYDVLGIRDLMAAPLFAEDKVIGILRVANRLGDISTFDESDLQLFETLANHASSSLENARLVGELQESLDHLTEMNRLKDDFVASVSHELRTPLTSIQGYVKTLLRPDVQFAPEDQRSFLETIERQSDRLHRLIEDLLVVARLESNKMSALMAPVSLERTSEHVVEELRDRAGASNFVVEFASDFPVVQSDEGKIHQIISNLVDNALKYAPDSPKITILGVSEAEGVKVSVVDQGNGIPADVQDKIFDRFYQVDSSMTRAVGGTGLGLYICKSLADALGGRLWLERSTEEGSTFSLWVPLKPPVIQSRPVDDDSRLMSAASA
ncbi:MAG: ATP-binding protein [Actinomycetota bacterium]|nr:ATP-binding protein [Actinomycetota bacterium]